MVIQYMAFVTDWLLSHGKMLSKFIYVVACIGASLLSLAKLQPADIPQFVYSFIS